MTWLRIHDGFTQNAKIAQLSDSQFRTWIRLLCYTASARDPTVDKHVIREVAGLDMRRVKVFHSLGLLDHIETTSNGLTPNLGERSAELTQDIAATSDGFRGEEREYFEVHDWAKYLPKEEQNAARQAKWRARRRNANRNADVDTESNGQPSRARAGTRGVPSRPQDQNHSPSSEARDATPTNDDVKNLIRQTAEAIDDITF